MGVFTKRNRAISDPKRIVSLDYWRAIAVLSVAFFHGGFWSYGFLGVDLFFVLSGYLVSRYLVDNIDQLSFPLVKNFFLSRCFKIWPSYFAFLFLGNGLAILLYSNKYPDMPLHGADWLKYIFFYQNYRATKHLIFDHIWSLCVEEHFYLLLPLGLFLWQKKMPKLPLTYALGLGILLGNLLRFASYCLHYETSSATHNRLDALLLGVLLYAIEKNKSLKHLNRFSPFFAGFALLSASIYFHIHSSSAFFKLVCFHGLVPIAFFLMLAGTLKFQWRGLKGLKFFSYYSFNWYLWHQVLYLSLVDKWHFSFLGQLVYLGVGLFFAIVATHLIEEPGLKLRERWRSAI